MSDSISLVKRKDLDESRWNACIDAAPNGLVYAYTYYLDHICKNWDALVLNDYESVMPVPWKRKFGIRYMYGPPFVQRLGVFGRADEQQLKQFYKKASRRVRYVNANFNDRATVKKMKWYKRVNYILPLQVDYETLSDNYTEECQVNIEKALKRGCVFSEKVSIQKTISMFRKAYGELHPHVKQHDYDRLYQLATEMREQGTLVACGVHHKETKKLLFAALMFRCNKRIYYALGAPSPEGRKARAGYFFLDEIIKRHADSKMLLDFEGSDIPNVAAFYQRFNPSVETYYRGHLNKLPWPVSLLKK